MLFFPTHHVRPSGGVSLVFSQEDEPAGVQGSGSHLSVVDDGGDSTGRDGRCREGLTRSLRRKRQTGDRYVGQKGCAVSKEWHKSSYLGGEKGLGCGHGNPLQSRELPSGASPNGVGGWAGWELRGWAVEALQCTDAAVSLGRLFSSLGLFLPHL